MTRDQARAQSMRLANQAATAERIAPGKRRSLLQVAGAVGGALLGLLPHLLHHFTLLAGTALVAGSGGTALFAVLGFAASVPLLVRLYRRFRTWWAPLIGLAAFVAMFAVSAFLIGPAISDTSGGGGSSPTVVDHNSHHH